MNIYYHLKRAHLVMDKTHLFVINLVKTQTPFFWRSLLYKRSCSGINSTFIVWCADKVGLEKDERKMEPEAQNDQVSLIESKCMHDLKDFHA